MDCRSFLGSALRHALASLPCFAISLALGCTHFKGATTEAVPTPAPEPATPVVVKKEKDKEEAKQKCQIAMAEFRSQAAKDKEMDPAKAQAYRERARNDFQQTLKADPKCQRAYVGLGRVYQDMEDHERAVATYQKGLKELPKSAVLWYEAGMCQAKHKQWDDAIAKLRSAQELDPENRVYINALGFTMARAGRLDDSYAFFEKALGEAKAHYNLARVLRHLDKTEECRAHLQLALQAKPDMVEAKQLLADLDNPSENASEETDDRLEAQVSFEDGDETEQGERKQ